MARIDFDKNKLENTINVKFSQLVRKVVIDGMRQLIRQSPVDTGRFKANWSTSITNMSLDTTESTTANVAMQTRGISTYKLGQTAFLHNNLEYALPLEYGSSEQAPKMWINNTANKMQSQLNRLRNIL